MHPLQPSGANPQLDKASRHMPVSKHNGSSKIRIDLHSASSGVFQANSEAGSPFVRGEAFTPSGQIATVGGVRGLCSCGLPVRPHTRFCGDVCRFWAKVRRGPHCWEWTSNRAGGRRGRTYGQFSIGASGERKAISAHVYIYQLTHGPVPDGLEVMHSCHNPICVRPDHLEAGTHKKNIQDSAALGHYHVARPSSQSLSPSQIEDIRVRLAAGPRGTANALAREYGVTKGCISQIKRGARRQYDAPLRPSLKQVG